MMIESYHQETKHMNHRKILRNSKPITNNNSQEEIKMSDYKNMELSDDMMASAAGGFDPIEPYPVGTRVLLKGDEGELTGTIASVHVIDQYMVSYDVDFDNGSHYRVPHQALKLI